MNDMIAAIAFDRDVLNDLVRHIRENTTDLANASLCVPTAHFTSKQRAAQERELFLRTSMVVGHVSELPDAGSFFALDSLHSRYLHPKPGGVGSRSINHAMVFRELGRHGKMIMARSRLKKVLDAGDEPVGDTKYVASSMTMYPNNVVIEAPDHVELWSVWPHVSDPMRCTVKFRFMVRPEILNPEMEARINKSWEILSDAATTEDFPMEEAIQRNANAWPSGSYNYDRNEKSAQHQHRQLFKDIDGSVCGPGTLSFR